MEVGAVFDCDGVLIDSAHVWREAEAELARRAGAVLNREDRRALATMTIAEVGEYFHRNFGLGRSGEDVVALIGEIMYEFYSQRAEAMPKVNDFLSGLAQRGVRLSVVSSTPSHLLRTGLRHVGLFDFFCSVLSVEDLHTNKRETLIFRHALADMGTAAAHTWGFDDSYYAIQTMNGLGMATVGVYDAENPCELDLLKKYSDRVTCDYASLDLDSFARGPQAAG